MEEEVVLEEAVDEGVDDEVLEDVDVEDDDARAPMPVEEAGAVVTILPDEIVVGAVEAGPPT